MDPMTAGVLAGGSQLLGTYMQNQASAKQAQDNRDFQERMSGTAHQREVADLKAAGLNPILSASGPGASTPTGASGEIASYGDGISKGLETAIAVKQQNKDFQLKDADIDNRNADTGNKKASEELIRNQSAQSAQDVKQKKLQNNIIEKTMESAIKKAKAEGDYSELNQIMGLINSGTGSLGNVIGIGQEMKSILNMLRHGSKNKKLMQQQNP